MVIQLVNTCVVEGLGTFDITGFKPDYVIIRLEPDLGSVVRSLSGERRYLTIARDAIPSPSDWADKGWDQSFASAIHGTLKLLKAFDVASLYDEDAKIYLCLSSVAHNYQAIANLLKLGVCTWMNRVFIPNMKTAWEEACGESKEQLKLD